MYGAKRGFPLFWFGQACSQLGDEITLLALPWLVAETTASPLATGALEAFSFLPVLMFGLMIGVVADRRSRRTSMIGADLLRFALVGSIPVAAWIYGDTLLAHVLVIAFLAGAARVLFEATSQSFLPDLVAERDLIGANARLSVTEGLAIVGGPAIAGLLITVLGAATTVVVDSVTFLVSAVAVLLLLPVAESRSDVRESFRSEIRQGLGVIRDERLIRLTTAVNSAANIASGMTAALVVIFLQRTLDFSGAQAGLVIGANGVGVLVAGRLAGPASRRFGFGRTVVVGHGVAAAGVLVLAFAGGSVELLASGAGMALIGLGVVLTIIASVTVRQRLVAGPLLGRVTATYRTVANGAIAVGALIGGLVGEFAGVREGLIAAGLVYVGVFVVAATTSLVQSDPVNIP